MKIAHFPALLLLLPTGTTASRTSIQLEHLLKTPAGSEIVVEATFGNTTSNPGQPFNSPRQVRQGPNPSDEVLNLLVTSVPCRAGSACPVFSFGAGRASRQ